MDLLLRSTNLLERGILMITSDDYLKLLHDAGIDTQRLSVIIHILERTDPKTNIFFGSYDTIAKKLA